MNSFFDLYGTSLKVCNPQHTQTVVYTPHGLKASIEGDKLILSLGFSGESYSDAIEYQTIALGLYNTKVSSSKNGISIFTKGGIPVSIKGNKSWNQGAKNIIINAYPIICKSESMASRLKSLLDDILSKYNDNSTAESSQESNSSRLNLNQTSSSQKDIHALFNELEETLKNYVIEDADAHEHHNYILSKITGISYKHPFFIINYKTYYQESWMGVEGYVAGNRTVRFTLKDATFSSLPAYKNNEYYLRIDCSSGIEISSPKGKTLEDVFKFAMSKMLSERLANEFNSLKSQITSSGFDGYLGRVSSNNNSSKSNSQVSPYSYYTSAGFAIKKIYPLEKNTLYISNYNNSAPVNQRIIDAYTCVLNADKGDPKQVSIININIIEIPNPAQSLSDYRKALSDAGINYVSKNWNGLVGVEYTVKQDMGEFMLPTKAFWGYKGNRFYLIQLGALTNAYSKYESLLNSIKIL